jgi:DNA-binding FadR family transcriptional regulator
VKVEIHQLTVLTSPPELANLLQTLTERITAMSEALETLITRVAEIETVADSAIELLAGLKAALDDAIASGDPVALAELSERLGAQSQELADAIVAHTPVA